jgi:L-lactate dehydrogenase complex protein LldF
VCPVKIDIPRLLLELRSEVVAEKTARGENHSERTAFRVFAWLVRRPAMYARFSALAAMLAPGGEDGWLRSIPPPRPRALRNWLSQRDLPVPAKQSFRQWWRTRRRRKES